MTETRSYRLPRLLALLIGLAISPAMTLAASDPPAGGTVVSRLVTEFSDWAGSTENATALVRGLRRGSTIVLSDDGGIFTPPTSVTFDPPTKAMGYGEIRIALALAETRLAQQGITDPTPEQLQDALVGENPEPGTTDGQKGILQMRADGMGWGAIAKSMGVTLGSVVSGKVAADGKSAKGKDDAPGLLKKTEKGSKNDDDAGGSSRGKSERSGSSNSSSGGKGGGSGGGGHGGK